MLVFALGGGLGFAYLFGDIQRQGLAALQHLPQLYTQIPDQNYVWLNPVLAWMLPQRSVLFGFSLALLTMALLWQASRLQDRAWAPFAFAGAVAGLTPLCHLHAYGTVVALAGFWTVLTPRREWLAYFVPALIVGVPILVWMWPPDNTSVCGDLLSIHGYCIQLGWLSSGDPLKDGPLL